MEETLSKQNAEQTWQIFTKNMQYIAIPLGWQIFRVTGTVSVIKECAYQALPLYFPFFLFVPPLSLSSYLSWKRFISHLVLLIPLRDRVVVAAVIVGKFAHHILFDLNFPPNVIPRVAENVASVCVYVNLIKLKQIVTNRHHSN